MNKVYAVVGGEYSDWWLEGFTTSIEEAIAYSQAHQNENLYVLEIKRLTAFTPKEKLWMRYDFAFEKCAQGIKFLYADLEEISERTCIFSAERPATVIYENTIIRSENPRYDGTVYVQPQNREKAEKIAQDAIYKWLSEQSNL